MQAFEAEGKGGNRVLGKRKERRKKIEEGGRETGWRSGPAMGGSGKEKKEGERW